MFTQLTYKRNLINMLATRAYYICSNWTYITQEFSFIRKLLYNNGFPKHFTGTSTIKTVNIISNEQSNVTLPSFTVIFRTKNSIQNLFKFKIQFQQN